MVKPKADSHHEAVVIERLVEVAGESCSLSPLMIRLARQTAHRNDWGASLALDTRQLLQKFEPIHLGHP